MGNYPVGKEDAAQMSALQILVDIGYVDGPESCTSVVHFLTFVPFRLCLILPPIFDWSPVPCSFSLLLLFSKPELVVVFMPSLYAKLFSFFLVTGHHCWSDFYPDKLQ